MPSNFVAFFGLVANCNYCSVLGRAARAVDAWTPAWHAQAKVPTLRGSKIAFIDFFIIKRVQSSIRATRSRIHPSQINCYVMGETEVKYICYNTSGWDLPDISALALGRCAPSGVVRIYLANPFLLCYNIYIYIAITRELQNDAYSYR